MTVVHSLIVGLQAQSALWANEKQYAAAPSLIQDTFNCSDRKYLIYPQADFTREGADKPY